MEEYMQGHFYLSQDLGNLQRPALLCHLHPTVLHSWEKCTACFKVIFYT